MDNMEIVLRNWMDSDIENLIQLCTHTDRTYLSGVPFPYRERDARWYVRFCSEHEGKTGIFRAIVADGKTVGSISINRLNSLLAKDAQLGFYLLPEYENMGIMTRATHMICHMAFHTLDIARITAPIISNNVASRRVVEKNSFELEGTLRNAVWKNDRSYDLSIYGKLR